MIEELKYGKFVATKEEAKERRKVVKRSGRCSCFTKLDVVGGYFVQSCPTKLCKTRKKLSVEENTKCLK